MRQVLGFSQASFNSKNCVPGNIHSLTYNTLSLIAMVTNTICNEPVISHASLFFCTANFARFLQLIVLSVYSFLHHVYSISLSNNF